MPILREGVHSADAATRQGVCLGLKEVLENVSKHQLAEHLSDVLPTVQVRIHDSHTPDLEVCMCMCHGSSLPALPLDRVRIRSLGSQAALTDTEPAVRAAAGDAFAILFKGGSQGSAVDSVVPSMIAGLLPLHRTSDFSLSGSGSGFISVR